MASSKPNGLFLYQQKQLNRKTVASQKQTIVPQKQTIVPQKQTFTSQKQTFTSQKQTITPTVLTDEYKTRIQENSFLGKNGYGIATSVLTPDEIAFLEKELFLIPVKAGGVTFGPPIEEGFSVLQTIGQYTYIPRFFGIQRYGFPDATTICDGTDISVAFSPEYALRDYQIPIVQSYVQAICTDHVEEGGGGGGILEVYCGAGKTGMSLYLISLLKKKTLIIVHKDFLANQWIEQGKKFLPNATFGRIQGDTFDVEGKDIVIGMVQTLYKRGLGEPAFQEFGLLIVDEVHRIGSEEFSKTLLKLSPKYILGVTATLERKDGLTSLIHMFLGPTVCSIKREADNSVLVRGVEFKHSDKDFNTCEYDIRGNIKYSTMISKICDFVPRSMFIVQILHDLIKESPHAQIIVLAHNISLLTFLYEAFPQPIVEKKKSVEKKKPIEKKSKQIEKKVKKKLAIEEKEAEEKEAEEKPIKKHPLGFGPNEDGSISVGYYKGGMKEPELKESETKQIILGSYMMASEGLDIKTLATMVFATPKTDIVQCVGRILREKRARPMVVDIIDTHGTFVNQWKKRKAYYKKNNYQIHTGLSIVDCMSKCERKEEKESDDEDEYILEHTNFFT